ncbi:30S ribosomal protein S3, partial [Francisella tularensis subsp. holarctica]|nr:30S ribosomal protein S3 [Francisella tularensis subsp. holarctica]
VWIYKVEILPGQIAEKKNNKKGSK